MHQVLTLFLNGIQGILPLGGLHERAAVPLSGAEHAPAGKANLHSSLDEDLLIWLCDQIADAALGQPLNVRLFASKSTQQPR